MKWNISASDKVFTSEYLEGVKAVTFNKENYKYNINLHRVWVEAFSCTSPIFFRKKIPQSTFPPSSLASSSGLMLICTSLLRSWPVGVSPQPCWWINIILSVAPNTFQKQCSASKFAELPGPVLWTTLVGPHCRREGQNNGASLTSPSTRSSVSSCTNSTGNDFFFPSCYFLSIKIMQTREIQQLLLLSLWNVLPFISQIRRLRCLWCWGWLIPNVEN